MSAMPLMIAALCVMAIAYRYYSAFLAAKVATLNDLRVTPAVSLDDGTNYHPTSKWVLFGHHFAAISGAGPLIGPVLAAQFGYLPGLIWIVIGVCLAGAVQDFLVLAASVRRGGKSLAQIAFIDIGKIAGSAAMIAILFILVIALAGLGKVVVKALGGESVPFPADTELQVHDWKSLKFSTPVPYVASPAPGFDYHRERTLVTASPNVYEIPPGSKLLWNKGQSSMDVTEAFQLRTTSPFIGDIDQTDNPVAPIGDVQNPGSSWGIFTIACTIPIALFVGFYMYRIRKGKSDRSFDHRRYRSRSVQPSPAVGSRIITSGSIT
jgi:carbon starvation protein